MGVANLWRRLTANENLPHLARTTRDAPDRTRTRGIGSLRTAVGYCRVPRAQANRHGSPPASIGTDAHGLTRLRCAILPIPSRSPLVPPTAKPQPPRAEPTQRLSPPAPSRSPFLPTESHRAGRMPGFRGSGRAGRPLCGGGSTPPAKGNGNIAILPTVTPRPQSGPRTWNPCPWSMAVPRRRARNSEPGPAPTFREPIRPRPAPGESGCPN